MALQALELPEDADPDTIRRRYRQIARATHPDIDGGGDAEAFIRATGAYHLLETLGRA